jgi:hypothetical protein
MQLRAVQPIRTDDRLRVLDRPAEGRRMDPPPPADDREPVKRKRFLFF